MCHLPRACRAQFRGALGLVHLCQRTPRRAAASWSLPEVSQEVRAFVGEPVAQRLVPYEVQFIDCQSAAEECVPDLLASRLLGVDCEGVALGRWGRLCLCQIATTDRVYLFDALREGVLDVLGPVLESSSIVKVMHDCREDASALLSQFGIELAGVFDTQVAHTMMLEERATRPFQISLNELLKGMLHLQNEQQLSLGERMREDPNVWFYRPLQDDLIMYAAQDVMYLPLLHRRLCDELRDPSGGRTLLRSRRYAEYSRMNLHLGSPKAAEKRGLRLRAMLATQTEAAHYFKLNLGAQRQGAVSRPEAVSRFKDLQFGDIADCWVSAWNASGNILFLEKLEPGTAVPEPPTDYTTGKYGRRRGRRPLGAHDG